MGWYVLVCITAVMEVGNFYWGNPKPSGLASQDRCISKFLIKNIQLDIKIINIQIFNNMNIIFLINFIKVYDIGLLLSAMTKWYLIIIAPIFPDGLGHSVTHRWSWLLTIAACNFG